MNWTQQQREAIEYRNNNILLAAAAGSGKTAVLVQRIIEMIEKDGVSVNELLVLTFTEAAASEMREKIKKAVQRALKADPENVHLQRQKLLMHSADISTVHSFCLNVLKSNIHLTALPVDFTLVSELENKILIKEALDEVLERFYANIDKDRSFAELTLGYGGVKNDDALREMILRLHDFSRSMAYPAKWLNDAVRPYAQTAKSGKISDLWWKAQLKESVERAEKEVFEIYDKIFLEIEKNLSNEHPYKAFFDDETENIRRAFSHMDLEDYGSVKEAVDTISFRTIQGVRKPPEDIEQAQNYVKNLRKTVKSVIDGLADTFKLDEDVAVERIRKSYYTVRTLKNIVLMVDRCYTRKKREKSLLDFNDLEHEALNLLVSKNGTVSHVAEKLRERFAAILVDEYQDTNNIQDLIFRTISRENKNIFMVGDLKQSIYKFRNAVPKLFSDKYELYGNDDEAGHLIRLFKNFRSRTEVVDAVNYVFGRIMSPEVGNIRYDSEEFLIQGADYPPAPTVDYYDTEFHMICCDSEDESEAYDKNEVEATVVASRITELIKSGLEVFDKDSGKMRAVEFRDMVVLMRKTKDIAPVFEKVFEEWGIPAYSEVGHSYLGALEIQTVLAVLQIIDNPRQDIPLIAVMRSPMWGFSPDELALIRTQKPEGMFFDAVCFAAEKGDAHVAEFLSDIENLRNESESCGVDRLIYRIYYEMGYYAYVGSLKHGRERQANLRVLLERANEFEHTKMSGLFSFMNYIETMRLEEKDMTPAKVFGEGENVVRIMSIHKSKGLEFPVVFLAGTGNEFNLKDAQKNIIWDEQGGIGAEYVDVQMRVRYPSLARSLVGQKLKKDMLSEEMRLLYVALTRAREKLIITAAYRNREKKWRTPVWIENGIVPSAYVRTLHSYRDWLAATFLCHPNAYGLREFCELPESVVVKEAGFGLKTFLYESAEAVPQCEQTENQINIQEQNEETDFAAEVEKRLGFEYSRKHLGTLPVKMSVSEAKRMQDDDGEYVPVIEPLRTSDMAKPKKMSGAERGTVVHFVMQMLDPKEITCEDDVKKQVEMMKADGIITSAQAEVIDCGKIAEFFLSSLGQRMKNAVRCEKEFSFYTKDTSDALLGNGLADEILLQGTMDCFFVEKDGRVVLVDYKTDRVKNSEEAEFASKKYIIQMKYYQKALMEIIGQKVDECYLYFMACGEAISMDIETI